MAFLKDFANQLSEQFLASENTNHTLDKVVDGKTVSYGALGDFASKFDQSAQRSYLEQGFLRKDPFNIDSKQVEILMQQPNATVLLKKRMFHSIGENYRTDLMDVDEKLYYRSMNILFQNKCKQISTLEKLSKIQKVSSTLGTVDEQMMSIIFSLTGSFDFTDPAQESSNLSSVGNTLKSEVPTFKGVVDRIRRIYAFNKSADTTTWIADNTNIFRNQFGGGTGVIEITNFTNFNTTVTTNLSGGRFSIDISDPYEAMVITEYDIERAIADATSIYTRIGTSLSLDLANQLIESLKSRLNRIRADRNASPITFKINPDTLLGKRVVAIIDNTAEEIRFDYDPTAIFSDFSLSQSGTRVYPEFLKSAKYDGLDEEVKKYRTLTGGTHDSRDSELSLFCELIAAIFNRMSMESSSKNELQQLNKLTNYARKKLRFNFLGKLIIQPMDSIHFYIKSSSKTDTKVLSGLKDMFSGMGTLQSFAKSLGDFKNQIDSLFNPNNLNVAIEKSVFVGTEFPNFVWNMIKPQFVNENEGAHVFAGVVNSASGSYNPNSGFKVSANGEDNSYYFKLGKINEKPGSDAWAGSIFDPLTPFQTKFDKVVTNYSNEIPTPLPENQIILSNNIDNEGPLFKFKAGPFAGRLANDKNYIQDKTVDPVTGRITRTFYAPDGLVYRWKEGIGAFVQYGSSFDLNSPDKVGVPSITRDPFAGQDVMNVISLLVTGHPYNFANYWNAVSNFDGFASDPHSRQNAAHSFSLVLRNALQKRNALWGNFIPFKNLVMNEESYAKTLQSLFTIKEKSSLVENKLKQLQEIENKAYVLGIHSLNNNKVQIIKQSLSGDVNTDITTITTNLKKEIDDLIVKLQAEDQKAIVQSGDDVTFNFDEFLTPGSQSKLADAATRRLIRRQVNFLTRRMSYNVRANEDKNLFIVDDSYDKDYDIAAFNSSLDNNLQLYSNTNLNISQKIKLAADLLNLEVFCDTQGHIRARSPQYNRMPSSVFSKMMYQKEALGIQVFPEFLNDIFSNQLSTLRDRLEVVEDEIRLDCAIFGKKNDIEALEFINTIGSTDGSGSAFQFVSSSEGNIADFSSLRKQSDPDSKSPQDKDQLLKVENQAKNTKDIFSLSQRYSFIQSKIENAGQNRANNPSNPYQIIDNLDFDNNIYVNDLIKRIETKSGQKVKNFTKDLVDTSYYRNNPGDIDIFKLTKDLSEKISERQKVLRLFYSALKNSKEFRSLDEDSSTANKLSFFGTTGNKNTPEVFEHMIEDETYDDLGPGSGKRYVIKNYQILNYTINETPPPYTYVEVQGVLNNFAPEGLPPNLSSFPGGGNGLVTAAAIDYDLWRTYGHFDVSPIGVPFLSNPVTQCAPYAVSLLSRARKQILKGSMTIKGNEYMQPGEVVFFEDRNLLFYVTQVTHNYTSLNSFNTTLTLEYGHSPGEYIPTTLDIIGKAIYNNKDIANYQVHKESSSFNESSYGPIIRDPNSNNILKSKESGGGGNYGPANATVINNILFNASYLVSSNSTKGNNIETRIELRVYYDSKLGSANPDLISFAEEIKNILSDPKLMQQPNSKNQNKKDIKIPKDIIDVIQVDMSSQSDHRSPSQKAWSVARDLSKTATSISLKVPDVAPKTETGGVPLPADGEPNPAVPPADEKTQSADANKIDPAVLKQERDKLRMALFGNVVDCWVKLKVLPPTT
jgi:hypothetical protein